MGFGALDHAGDAFGKKPVIGMDDFAVFALGGGLLESVVPILEHAEMPFVSVNTDVGGSLSVFGGDLEGAIRAAVVHDDIFPVGICLCHNTVNALSEVLFTIEYGSDYADKRLC